MQLGTLQRLVFLLVDAGASFDEFPRWSVGTIIALEKFDKSALTGVFFPRRCHIVTVGLLTPAKFPKVLAHLYCAFFMSIVL